MNPFFCKVSRRQDGPLARRVLPFILAGAALSPALAFAQTKVEAVSYRDDFANWKLGQISTVSINGTTAKQISYDGLSRPTQEIDFGKVRGTITYAADGTISTISDGNGSVTTLSQWKRGKPQIIQFPGTQEAPAGASSVAMVNDSGWVESITDENGHKTCYAYDAMGRLNLITYPSETQPGVCDTSTWLSTGFEFRPMTAVEWRPPGVAAGQWRRYTFRGNYQKTEYFDAMWRPVLSNEYDAYDTPGTLRSISTSYDALGRVAFRSYPSADLVPAAAGIWTFYDALGRPTQTKQDSEHGLLTTLVEHIAGFQTRVTNPRGHQIQTIYQTFDQPTYDYPAGVSEFGGDRHTEIYRDIFSKITALRRRNGDASTQVWRYYVYDAHQQLCKIVEPETGATIMDYDNAGNLQWSASGLHSLVGTSTCDTIAGRDSGRKVTRYYDARNRLKTLDFPGGSGNQSWEYWPDGLPYKITTHNDGLNAGIVENTYAYNGRRMLTGESSSQLGWYTWGIGYGYDSTGSLSTQTYPTGLAISYGPNALGQATRASDQTGYSYAHGATYYPNGSLKQFTYANGIVHSMAQNARQLPQRVSSPGVADFRYDYDANANVTVIADETPGRNSGVYSRWMTYDGLDRLTAAGSCMFGGDCWHRFAYDALDNIRSWKLPGVKDYAEYVYNPQNQLANIKNSGGASVVGFEYDPQGNLANKNGQGYLFDYGNRLRSVAGKENYRYDAYGRRVLAWEHASQSNILSQYSLAGQIIYQADQRISKNYENIYLAGSVVAVREYSPSGGYVAKFHHTDALGSPVAITNQAGTVIERNDYEPYGAVIGEPAYQGIGYTGHVHDGATGLVYMQQRYFDPQTAMFLSADPAGAISEPQSLFNRYRYANANPFKYYDPSGMFAEYGFDQQTKQEPELPPTDIEPVVVVGTRPEPAHFTPPDRPLDVQVTPPTPQLFQNRVPPIGEKTFLGYVGACRDYIGLPWELVFPATAGGVYGEIGKAMQLPGAKSAARVLGPVGMATGLYEVATTALCSLAGIQTLQ